MTRISFSILAAILCTVTLSACEGPGAWPRGYAYHKERFKSPAPGPSSKFTDAQRENMNPAQAKQIRNAMHDLARTLTDRAGLAPKPVYVQTADPLPPFYAMIDNDLRDVLAHIGYAMTAAPDNAYIIQYQAEKIDAPKGETPVPAPNVRLSIIVIDKAGREGKILTTQTGDYFIQGAEDFSIPHANFPLLQKAGE